MKRHFTLFAWAAILLLLILPCSVLAQTDLLVASPDYRNQLFDGTPTNAPGTAQAQAASIALFSGSVASLTNSPLALTNAPAPNDGQAYLVQSVIGQSVGYTPNNASAPVIIGSPSNIVAVIGGSATLVVIAAATPSPTYQWFFNATNPIAGATNSTLAYSSVGYEKAGSYTVVITNAYGAVTSSVAVLQVAQPLTVAQLGRGNIAISPLQTNYAFGQTVTLTATAGRYYTFLRWSDGVTNNPRSITITTSNNLFTAVFTNTVPLETTILKQWEAEFGGSGTDQAESIQQTSDGGYIIGGYSSSDPGGNKTSTHYGGFDYWVVKLNPDGSKQWENSFGGSGDDYLLSLQQTSDGGYVLGGYSNSGISGNKTNSGFGNYDFWIVRLDANGNKLWDRSYGGSGDDRIYSIQQTSDGGFILGGQSNSGSDGNKTSPNYGQNDFWVVRTDANGNKLWDAAYGGNSYDWIESLQQTIDGGFIFGGYSWSGASGNKTSPFYGSPDDYWVVKTDANGNKLWENDFGGSGDDVGSSVRQTTAGGFVLGGFSGSGISGNKTAANYGGNYDFWLVRMDINGNKLGDYSFGGTGEDVCRNLAPALDGGLYLAGYSDSSPSGNKTSPNYGGRDCWVVKVDGNFNKVWDYSFGGTNDEDMAQDRGIQQTTDGGFVFAGTSASGVSGNKTSTNYGGQDYWVVKAFPREAPIGMPVVLVNGQYSLSNSFAIPATNAIISVTLQTSYADGFLFYTLDGSDPDSGSLEYTGPFPLTDSTVVRAVAYDSGGQNPVEADPVTVSVVPVYNLTNTTPGGGSVAFNPPGGIYLSNAVVTATAGASNGWTFLRWAGASSATNNPLALTVNQSTNLAAVFGTTISTTTNGTIGASVVLWPTNGPYAYGSIVRFVAVPPAGKYFNKWFTIAASGPTNNPLDFLVVSNNPVASAFFNSLTASTNYTLTVLLNGFGMVTRTPARSFYASNTVVSLTAVADSGYVFTGWSGDAGGLANPVNVTLNTNQIVTATFASVVPPAITSQPQSLTVNRDSNAVFSVTATGPLLAYQWLHAGTNLPGATGTSYNLASAQKADGGNYQVIITNSYGSATSSVAVLTVNLPYTWITLAGLAGQSGTNDGTGNTARFSAPEGSAVDFAGNIYVADSGNNLIRKVSLYGVVTTLTGWFAFPLGVAVDASNNIYVADSNNHAIQKITPAGVVTTLAGLVGNPGSADGTGNNARFNTPRKTAVDVSGNVYVADDSNHTIRKITPAGVVSTLAGLAGNPGNVDGTGSAARFSRPFGVAVDSLGNVYVADSANHTIRKVTPVGTNWVVTTLAGSVGNFGSADGTGASAQFNYPASVSVDSAGNVYVADSSNNTIRKVTPEGVVTTLGGQVGNPGSADGTGSSAQFRNPNAAAVDTVGNLYIADVNNNTIRKGIPDYGQPIIYGQPQSLAVNRDSNAVLSVSATFSGTAGYQWLYNGTNIVGATSSNLVLSSAQKADGGNYSVVITNSYGSATSSVAVLTVNLPYTWITLAGRAGQTGTNDGVGTAALFNQPTGIAIDSSNNLYVADYYSFTIRKIIPSGTVSTFVGLAGVSGSSDGTGSSARFNNPNGLAADLAGNIYVADSWNHTIRKITPAGVVTTLAGSPGNQGSADGLSNSATFNYPEGVAIDSATNILVADYYNHTIRRITPAGTVTTLAGSAGNLGSADGTGGTARFNYPASVAVDGSDNLYVGDTRNRNVRKVTAAGVVTSLAGLAGISGTNDGTGTSALFDWPCVGSLDALNNVYVTEESADTIRKISSAGVVATIAGLANTPGTADGAGSVARFSSPRGPVFDSDGNLYVADTGNNTIRKGIPDYGQPIIYGQPQSQIVAASAAVTLGVTNTGALPLGYQWSFNGTNLAGATNSVLNFANFQATNVGSYFVVISNVYSSATSSVAVLSLVGSSNQPPAVAITSPANNATFTAPVNVSITTTNSDSDGAVVQVAFLSGVTPLGTVTNTPFSFTWTNAPLGTNVLTVVATDNGGLSTTSAAVSVIVQTALPLVFMTSPTNGNSFYTNNSIVLSAIASDADTSIGHLEFYSGATLLASLTNTPLNNYNWSFTWSNAPVGSYALTARAVDLFGPVVTSAPVNITVALPPSTNPPVFLFSTNNYYVNESNGAVVVTILNNGDLGGLVNYTTHDGTALGGSGYSGSYTIAQGSFTFAAGQHATNLTIGIRDNFITGADINFTVQLFNPSAGTLGAPDTATVTIHQNDVGGATNSLLTTASPSAQPATAGSLRLVLTPPDAGGQWRFPWEQGWHLSGDTVPTLEAGNYDINFRSVPNYLAYPSTLTIAVTNGGTTVVTNDLLPAYTSFDTNSTGSLTVNIGPNTPAGYGWRFIGETPWRSNNVPVTSLLPDVYFIEFASVSGWTKPGSQAVPVFAGQGTAVSVNYLLAQSLPGSVVTTPGAVIPSQITDVANQPYGYNGQLYTDVGYGSGVAVRESVVLTAAHMVFNDATLSYVSQAYWSFQKEVGTFAPKPIAARGWYVLSGYASQRTNDLTVNGYGIDQSSAASRNLDVAALYFLQPAARGGYGGYLASDAVPNPYLTGSALKKLVGYPVDGSLYGQNVTPGQMYATAELSTALTQASNNVYQANWFLSYPGNSGGPLYVKFNNYFYPAAVYLGTVGTGNSSVSVVRAINSEVVNLISLASSQGDSGTNYTGGGVITLIAGGVSSSHPAYIQVNLGPSNAVSAGAGWRLQGDAAYGTNATYTRTITSTNAVIEFKAVAGWNPPTNQSIGLTPGQVTVLNATYTLAPSFADLAAGISGPVTVAATNNFTYTLLVTNFGTAVASNVWVTNFLPAGVTFVSASGGGTNTAGMVTWPLLAGLTNGGMTNFTLTVKAPALGRLTNTLSVGSSISDTNLANNTAQWLTLVIVSPPVMAVNAGNGIGIIGTPGTTYRVEYRTSLSSGQWLPLQTNTIGSGVNYVLPWPPTNGAAAFYRTVWLP